MEAHLTCPICLEVFVDPVETRPCEHYFCDGCLKHYCRTPTVRHCNFNFSCPECRGPIKAVLRKRTMVNIVAAYLQERTDREAMSKAVGRQMATSSTETATVPPSQAQQPPPIPPIPQGMLDDVPRRDAVLRDQRQRTEGICTAVARDVVRLSLAWIVTAGVEAIVERKSGALESLFASVAAAGLMLALVRNATGAPPGHRTQW
ncbi:hypothetical protein V8F06_005143 [Rhypophila decipiens]